MKNICIFFGLGVALFTSNLSYARDDASGPIVDHKIKYFTVEGKTYSALSASFKKQAFNKKNKYSFNIAITNVGDIKYDISYRERQNKCHIENLKISTTLKTKLPKWRDYNKVSRQTQAVWDEFDAFVQKQQLGYADISTKYTGILFRKLDRVRPQDNCKLLKERVERVKGKYEKKYTQALKAHHRSQYRSKQKHTRHRTPLPSQLFHGYQPDGHAKALASLRDPYSKKFRPRKITASSLKQRRQTRYVASRKRAHAHRASTIRRLNQATRRAKSNRF